MRVVLSLLLGLLTLEGLLLLVWPERLRAIIGQTPEKALRIAGGVELLLVIVLLGLLRFLA